MCGVIGLIYERPRPDLGRVAGELLKMLEYRGYDSTGGIVQGDEITLRKAVGAPSVMVEALGIDQLDGQIFCGQVRWATFGAVNERNAQPHEVKCKAHIYGAHNGNVTNCDDLKTWLSSEGHDVQSDNDGEMLVHTVEHYLSLAVDLDELGFEARREAFRSAILLAARRLEGSYASVVVDPVTRTVWAIKQGSSLYFGTGHDEQGGHFTIASSDLSSVLKLTRVLIPLSEGELVQMDGVHHQLYRAVDGKAGLAGEPLERRPVRSRLRATDAALLPGFSSFMAQEIDAQDRTVEDVVTAFRGGSVSARSLEPVLVAQEDSVLEEVVHRLDGLGDEYEDEAIQARFFEVVDSPVFSGLIDSIPSADAADLAEDCMPERLSSSEAGFLADLIPMVRGERDQLSIRVIDALLERAEVESLLQTVDQLIEHFMRTLDRGGRIYIVCCGSSLHAAKSASVFMNEMARATVVPTLPGEFRGQYEASLQDGDLLVAVSQSGETKDLIDVMNSVIASGKDVRRACLVNNVSSSLAQELCELVIPLRCGPEIAVPATKSFMNQMAVFFCLALRLGQARVATLKLSAEARHEMRQMLLERADRLKRLPALIRESIQCSEPEVELAAQMLHLVPSMHILAIRVTSIAREGALKIREVVLNHTEGFEGSEFKHGPNTILGFNTISGPRQVDALLRGVGERIDAVLAQAFASGLEPEAIRRLARSIPETVFAPQSTAFELKSEERALFSPDAWRSEVFELLHADYPLIYITGPDARDVSLMVSQINTHKIRRSITVVLAEEHPALRQAATKPPADNANYRSVFINLPRTGDTLMTMFSATVVLQRLALKMSTMKAIYLDGLGIKEHGVHPDVPKNVSKSITVD